MAARDRAVFVRRHLDRPLIAGFCSRYPDVGLEIVATHISLDLFAEDVDIALRFGILPDSSLVARRLGSFATSIYASLRTWTRTARRPGRTTCAAILPWRCIRPRAPAATSGRCATRAARRSTTSSTR
ncbi:LysR substrate-binding domain-containing protein [Burkholderia sp. AU6039]|uniref:LysR substrate-binding domain-containing protein n=1 Tax=Burkholderia sp. AU6039 TaxID=2015344 RepID=UPI00359456DE